MDLQAADAPRGAPLYKQESHLYAAYRPSYPDELFDLVLTFAGSAGDPGRRRVALDVATGTGQTAAALLPRFARVVACDASPERLAQALPLPNVEYLCAPAERLPAATGSVDLVTVSQALHWFDVPKFYEECRRVLRPGGALACWGYGMPAICAPPGAGADPAALAHLRRALDELHSETLAEGPSHESACVLVDGRYQGLEPGPDSFGVVQRLELSMEKDMSVQAFLGYVASWSSYAVYRRRHPDRPDPLRFLARQIQTHLDIDDPCDPAALRLRWPLFAILSRDPVPLPPGSPATPGTP